MARPKKEWLRLYADVIYDDKIRSLSIAGRWIWIAVMCLARKSPQPGALIKANGKPVTIGDISDAAKATDKDVKVALEEFVASEMVHLAGEVYFVTNWRERQFESDDSAPRVKAHRDRKSGGGDEYCNGEKSLLRPLQDRYNTQNGDMEPPPENGRKTPEKSSEKQAEILSSNTVSETTKSEKKSPETAELKRHCNGLSNDVVTVSPSRDRISELQKEESITVGPADLGGSVQEQTPPLISPPPKVADPAKEPMPYIPPSQRHADATRYVSRRPAPGTSPPRPIARAAPDLKNSLIDAYNANHQRPYHGN